MRKTWVLVAASVLVAATSGVALIFSAKHATAAARESPPTTATVELGRLSDVVSQSGTLTHRAGSDGSPYTVIDRACGTYIKLEGEPGSDLDPDSPRFQTADDACKALLPAMAPHGREGGTRSDARVREVSGARLPELPRPEVGKGISIDAGEHPELDPSNPTFQAASEACGGPGEGDTNTQTSGGAP